MAAFIDPTGMMSKAEHQLETVEELRGYLADLGALPLHTHRILRDWLSGRAVDASAPPAGARRSAALQSALPHVRDWLDGLVRESARISSEDQSCRHLLRLRSGRTIETVDLPRDGLCISTQVGCAVRCRFCKTGESGLIQQLSTLEVLAQVALSRRERRVRRVVFMGLGEPSHNLESVLEAIAVLGTEGNLGHKNLVFSTVGDATLVARLLEQPVRPALALSLHTLDRSRRGDLLPHAPSIDPIVLVETGLAYADRTTYPLLIQWTLLEGINDSLAEAKELAALLSGRRAIVNLIPFNRIEGSSFTRPSVSRCVELVRAIKGRGVRATLRFSVATAVGGGCGQLRARFPSA